MASQPAPAQPTLPQVVAELQNLHSRLSETNTKVATIQQHHEQLTSQVTQLLAHLGSNATSTKKQQLPTPEQFTGSKWDTWKTYAQAKIHIDGTAIGTLEAQYWYLYGCLGSNIKALLLPPLDPAAASPTYLLEALARVYEDPNKADKAADRLAKMSQMQDESFSAYLARFERTLFEAGAQGWPDLAKVSALRAGLSVNLKKKLEVQLVVPSRYEDFVKALHQLSQGLQRGTAPGSSGNWSKEHKSEPQINMIGAIQTRSMKELLDAPSSDDEGQDN